MIRVRAVLEYDGTAYRGWQSQPHGDTVQDACEAALAGILGRSTSVVASGRTDAGVHARGQVVHFDHPGRIGPGELRRAWNAGLPPDVWVRRLEPADSRFHARFDATARTYRYVVATGERAPSPFVRRFAWPLRKRVDWETVEDATGRLVGAHDFRAFAKGAPSARTRPGSRPGRCVVARAEWIDVPGGRALEITADRFLRHMVRAVTGAVLAAGRGRVAADEIAEALGGGRRTRSVYAPPQGLFLWRVEYPDFDGGVT